MTEPIAYATAASGNSDTSLVLKEKEHLIHSQQYDMIAIWKNDTSTKYENLLVGGLIKRILLHPSLLLERIKHNTLWG